MTSRLQGAWVVEAQPQLTLQGMGTSWQRTECSLLTRDSSMESRAFTMKLEGCKEKGASDIDKPTLWKLAYLLQNIYYVLGITVSKHFVYSFI